MLRFLDKLLPKRKKKVEPSPEVAAPIKEEKIMLKENLLPAGCYSTKKMKSVDGVVIHFISSVNVDKENKYDMQTNYDLFVEFCLPGKRGKLLKPGKKKIYASAHYLMGRDGETWQLVPLEYQAWHAGKSEWDGRKSCNGFMLGIEVIGEYSVDFEEAQYVQLASLLKDLQEEYGFEITRDLETSMVIGHEHVSPGRKKDPGPTFDWPHLWDLMELN